MGGRPNGVVNPFALTALERLGYPTVGLRFKSWLEFARPHVPRMDSVFTLCYAAHRETCPIWPGGPMTAHWGIEDPATVMGADSQR